MCARPPPDMAQASEGFEKCHFTTWGRVSEKLASRVGHLSSVNLTEKDSS